MNARTEPWWIADGSKARSQAKFRVLHCVYSGLGGQATDLFTLLRGEAIGRFEHSVVFFGIENLLEDHARTCNGLQVPFAFVEKRGRLAFSSYHQLLTSIAQMDPDVVVVNGTPVAVPVLLWRRITRQKWSVVVRETQANHLKTALEWLGSGIAALFADAVIYLTDEYRAEIEERLGLVFKGRSLTRVIPNGVEAPENPVPAHNGSGRIRLTMVSRLVAIKDHRTLIEALRILIRERNHTEIVLHIVGAGPMLECLRAQSNAAGVSSEVVFTGLLARSSVAEVLGITDVYVHCTYGETMSNSILEAMAAGLPVVATKVPGVSNLIRNGFDGVLVSAENAVELANALEELIRSPELRRRLGLAARERVLTEMSSRRIVAEYDALFADLGLRSQSIKVGR